MQAKDNISRLQNKLGYDFRDERLVTTALTHRSFDKNHNERLEYLGDSILGFIIAEALYHHFPDQPEGVLTRFRASLVKRETLAKVARSLELGEYLQLGTGEKRSGGWRRDSILSNTLEAIIGAIYLDSDMLTCKSFVLTLFQDHINNMSPEQQSKDPKTELQEYLQARKLDLPDYKIVAEEGEAHNRQFTVECRIEAINSKMTAQGKSKRAAEQTAAQKILEVLYGQ
jgi:ribonuclease-3